MMTTSHEAFAIVAKFRKCYAYAQYTGERAGRARRGLQCTMPNLATTQIGLVAHPTTQSDAIQSLDVQLSVLSPGVLTLGYTLQADMSRIRVEAEGVPGPADHLWEHTCFEAFIQPCGSRGYYEFNFSPTRQWAVYRFNSYREGMTPMHMANPPDISIRKGPNYLELQATFPLPISAGAGAAQRPKLALSAVVEEESGRLCYWAARHSQGKPDFHHPDGFTFEL
jgi:hypothetical protein